VLKLKVVAFYLDTCMKVSAPCLTAVSIMRWSSSSDAAAVGACSLRELRWSAFLKHLRRRSLCRIHLTVVREMFSSWAISLCVEWVSGLSSWFRASCSTRSMLTSHRTVRGRPAPVARSVSPVSSIFFINRFSPVSDHGFVKNSDRNALLHNVRNFIKHIKPT